MTYRALIRPILFALSQGDAERAHVMALEAMKLMQRAPLFLSLIAWHCQANKQQPVTHYGITFPNDVGLAAGFDKNGEVIPFLQALGPGFLEIGTVLPKGQPGNPRPRMFRIPEYDSLINRMGFNSEGADVVRRNLQRWQSSVKIPIGISLGKHKDTAAEVEPLVQDCALTLALLREFADYWVINISSPNTQGLRGLQTKEYARMIARGIVQVERGFALQYNEPPKPVLIKFACDMAETDMLDAAEACRAEGVSGFVCTNTTTQRPFVGKMPPHAEEIGGLSGPLLHDRAVRAVDMLRKQDSKALIIGVGGIRDFPTAQHFRDVGADLVQLYTGLIYEGPRVIRDARGLLQA